MIVADVQVDFVGADFLSQQAFRMRFKVAPVDLNPAFRAFELDTVVCIVASHYHAVRVFVCQDLKVFAVRRDYLDRAAVFEACAPLRDIEVRGEVIEMTEDGA